MAKCKYPNEICANMTMLNGTAYCDSVPCSLKDEVKKTNADKIRAMSDEELAYFLRDLNESCLAGTGFIDCSKIENCNNCFSILLNWLKSEAK